MENFIASLYQDFCCFYKDFCNIGQTNNHRKFWEVKLKTISVESIWTTKVRVKEMLNSLPEQKSFNSC